MRVRAIAALNSLPDPEFFVEVAEGLRLIHHHGARLGKGANTLADQNQGRAANVLAKIAGEESAKYLILLDSVRCPRKPPKLRSAQLKRYNDHLSKGIYAKTARICPASLEEVFDFVDMLRQEYYLDGPEGIESIFRNEIKRGREEAMYIDYVEMNGRLKWWDSNAVADTDSFARLFTMPSAVRLTNALHNSGFTNPESLQLVADIWRDKHWNVKSTCNELRQIILQTLQSLEQRELLEGTPGDYRIVLDHWTFPLIESDLSEIEVDIEQLKRQRNAYSGW